MLLHFVTILWIAFMAIQFMKNKGKALLNPVFYGGIAHMVYFAALPTTGHSNLVGLAHLVVMIGLLLGYYLPKTRIPSQRIDYTIRVDNGICQNMFLIFCLFITVMVPLLQLSQGYSLFEIFTAFYARGKVGKMGQAPAWFAYVITGFKYLPFVGLAIGKLWLNVQPRHATKILWLLLLAVNFLMTFASGIRSGLLFFFIVVMLSDVYCWYVLGLKPYGLGSLAKYVKIGAGFVLVVFLMSFLSAFRTVKFSSVDDVIHAMKVTVSVQATESFVKTGHQNINDFVVYSFEHYKAGRNIPYGYSLWASLSNPVPRFLWPDKPVGYGKVMARDMMGPTSVTSVAAGLAGEGYANFGIPGPFIAGVMMGLLLFGISRILLKTPDLILAAVLILAYSWITGWLRGDWLGLNLTSYQMITSFIVLRILRLITGGAIQISLYPYEEDDAVLEYADTGEYDYSEPG